jgi:hypothetical protein
MLLMYFFAFVLFQKDGAGTVLCPLYLQIQNVTVADDV